MGQGEAFPLTTGNVAAAPMGLPGSLPPLQHCPGNRGWIWHNCWIPAPPPIPDHLPQEMPTTHPGMSLPLLLCLPPNHQPVQHTWLYSLEQSREAGATPGTGLPSSQVAHLKHLYGLFVTPWTCTSERKLHFQKFSRGKKSNTFCSERVKVTSVLTHLNWVCIRECLNILQFYPALWEPSRLPVCF